MVLVERDHLAVIIRPDGGCDEDSQRRRDQDVVIVIRRGMDALRRLSSIW
jgi:hypothetical protein